MSTEFANRQIITDGLVFYIDSYNKKSYVSGSTVTIDLVNSIDGDLINGVGFDGKSWTFDGVDDFIDCDPLLPIMKNDTQGTIEAWVKINDSTPIENKMIFMGGQLGDDELLGIWCNTSGLLRAALIVGGVIIWAVKSNTKYFQDNQWTHVVVTQEGDIPRLYGDGELIPQTIDFNTDTTLWYNGMVTNSLTIGNRRNDITINYWGGEIPLVKYYNRGLSTEEVLQNYNALKGRFINYGT